MDEFPLQLATIRKFLPTAKNRPTCAARGSMTDKRYANLWIINRTARSPPAHHRNRPILAALSPDSTRIAYLSDADGKQQSISAGWIPARPPASPISRKRLTPSPGPRRKMLSFSSFSRQRPAHRDLPALLRRKMGGARHGLRPPRLSLQRHRYLKPGFMQVFVVSAEGGAPRQVTNGNFPTVARMGSFRAAWSPDSKFLLVSANRHPESDHELSRHRSLRIQRSDGALRALTNRKGPTMLPAFRPR